MYVLSISSVRSFQVLKFSFHFFGFLFVAQDFIWLGRNFCFTWYFVDYVSFHIFSYSFLSLFLNICGCMLFNIFQWGKHYFFSKFHELLLSRPFSHAAFLHFTWERVNSRSSFGGSFNIDVSPTSILSSSYQFPIFFGMKVCFLSLFSSTLSCQLLSL